MGSSNQSLVDASSILRSFPDIDEIGINDMLAKNQEIRRLLAQAGPKIGSGNPNGNVVSSLSRFYVDISVSPAVAYINPNEGVNTGWLAI